MELEHLRLSEPELRALYRNDTRRFLYQGRWVPVRLLRVLHEAGRLVEADLKKLADD